MKSNKYSISTMKFRGFLLVILTMSILLVSETSCKKFLDIKPPNDKLVTKSVFADSVTASSAIVGIYATLMQGNVGFMGYKSVIPCLSSDELQYTATYDKALIEFNNNDINITNSRVNGIWTELYTAIYMANAIIEGVDGASTISPTAKQKLTAESKFIRAFCYFYLVNYFGDIPLVTSTAYQNNSSLPRSSVATVYAKIIDDLTEAKSNLYNTFPTNYRARPTKSAASALLSRVYLFTKDFVNAENEATALISNSSFSLLPNLNLVFKKESTEIIWQLATVVPAYFNSFDGNVFVPGGTYIPTYVLRPEFVNAFDSNDKRELNWINGVTVSGSTYYYPYKYKAYTGGTNEEYEVVFRLAEQYLIRAEARCQQNKVMGTNGAESDINVIRNRAGLGNTTATDLPSMLKAIEVERRNELFAEWGNRWFDLKRWPSSVATGKTRADDILSPLKGNSWQATDVLWPIPASQISLNINLKQNSGY